MRETTKGPLTIAGTPLALMCMCGEVYGDARCHRCARPAYHVGYGAIAPLHARNGDPEAALHCWGGYKAGSWKGVAA